MLCLVSILLQYAHCFHLRNSWSYANHSCTQQVLVLAESIPSRLRPLWKALSRLANFPRVRIAFTAAVV